MLFDFANILVFLIVGSLFVGLSLVVSRLVQTVHPTPTKLSNYECGEEPIGSPWIKFNIRFYMVALGFIIFDIETVFLFPWATVFRDLGWLAFVEMMVFVVILLVGLAYIWGKGDIEWVKPRPVWGPGSDQAAAAPEAAAAAERGLVYAE